MRYVLQRVPLFDRWELLLLDGGYASPALIHYCETVFGIRVEIVKHNTEQQGFEVLPKRWIVERTFA